MDLLDISRELVASLGRLRFGPPVKHVYNPLEYAAASYRTYVTRYGQAPREVLMFGMNPGPWGMAQTGVPFGEVSLVRNWLGIAAPVKKPANEHPKRPVEGFNCTRSEVSGTRLWGWARERFKKPEAFFERFFVANYCPLCFLESEGRNRTPDKLPAAERDPLIVACDKALRRTVAHFRPRIVIGIGSFAETRARNALAGIDVQIGRILHPSPASPAANRNWASEIEKQLAALDINLPPKSTTVSQYE